MTSLVERLRSISACIASIVSAASLVERLRGILPLLEELETGQDCEEYAYAKGKSFQAMTYAPEAFEALRSIPEAADTIEAMQAEIERQEELVRVYRGAQLRAEEKLCREQANSQGWKKRAELLETKLDAALAKAQS